MQIGELSARTGVSQRLLRYYEEQGLLAVRREPNGYRRYGDEAVTTVRQIRAVLGAGLSTDVIRTLLPCASGDRPEMRQCPRVVDTVSRELAVMDERIESLRQSRDVLSSYRPRT
jgi:DNA-binding transcriptional MerR regulator